MSKIKILPEILSNKIAAGEVVARPASVVKELVENAIDAGSTRILVDIEQGGRKSIRVSDNGHGMGRDDALLCLERYATSKITTDPDLFAIRTLGFRGEALPSIASVSRLTLVTRETNAAAGTQIVVAGGRMESVSDAGAPAGTMITVADLFYNTPARRKFLKSVDTEMGHIADTMASMALGRPSVQFQLSHNSRMVKRWTPAADPEDRVADVLGAAIRKALLPVSRINEDIQISGWTAAPRIYRSTARGIYLFVNHRWVKDRIVHNALLGGYAGRLMKGRYPVAVLFLRVPFDQVDVNVHPTKHEIRFAHPKRVHDMVREAVGESLRSADPTRRSAGESRFAALDSAKTVIRERQTQYRPMRVPEQPTRFGDDDPALTAGTRVEAPGGLPDGSNGPWVAADHPRPPAGSAKPAYETNPPAGQAALWKRRFFGDLTCIGQYKGTYIICEAGEDLMLIDQHAAHERILFEQLQRQTDAHRPASQRLLLPETIDLGFGEAQILEKLIPELNRYGLEIDPFGGNTFVIKAIPTPLASDDVAAMVTQIVEKTAHTGLDADMATILDGCLMVMACHHAVRAHRQLTSLQIKAMLEQLDACSNPSHCPHGRPIWIRWTLKDLEKQFQRIV